MGTTTTQTASQTNQPTFVIVMGGIAAGKSSLARKFIQNELPDAILIDIDQFVLASPEYWAILPSDPENAYGRVYEQASHAAKKAMAEALAWRLNLGWEITVAGTAISGMLAWLNELGYNVSVRGIDCSVEVAIERANKRVNDPNNSIHFHRD